MRLFRLRAFAPRVVAVLALVSCASPEASKVEAPAWLAERARVQRELADKSAVISDFRFSERGDSSGITFVNRIVDDAGRTYKPVHYDHGMGTCVADVDGDGADDLYFVTQLGTNQLWKNTGGGRFENITERSGTAMPDAISVGCSFGDIDNDGRPDLFVTTVRHGNRLFLNSGAGQFRDITVDAGVGYVGHSSGAVFFDYDRDGLLDLFVANVGNYTTSDTGAGGYYVGRADAFEGHLHPDRTEHSILYRNLGRGRFRDVTRETGLVDGGWSGDATVIDVNDDGFPDLYVPNMQGENHLWLNEGGRRFRDATAAWFPKTPWGAMGVKSFDFNGDERLDLFVTDMHSDMFAVIPPDDWAAEKRKSFAGRIPPQMFPTGQERLMFGNALFAKRPADAGRRAGFDEVSDRMGVETYWPWGPSVGDLNADGWDDILVVNSMNFPYRYAPNSLLLNDAGQKFMGAEFVVGVEPRSDGVTHQVWFRPECGAGGADVGSVSCNACTAPDAASVGCRHDADGGFSIMGSRGARSAVIFDLDGDGDLDIVTNEFNARPQVLISGLAQSRTARFLNVRLRGTKSNRQGIGAQVTAVMPDGTRRLKAMDGKSGYLSQSDLPLYFGLADADHVAAIEIRWPSGTMQRVDGPIKANQTLEIIEP